MIITKIYLAKLSIPLRTPFVTALRRVEYMDETVVIIETRSGHKGYGEAPPTAAITGDTAESIAAAIGEIAALLIGQDINVFHSCLGAVHETVSGNPSAKAALEIALYDLWAQNIGLPLHRALGAHDDDLRTGLTISINPLEEMVADSVSAVKRGFDHLKVKVGLDVAEDMRKLAAIRSAVGDSVAICVDANQGWTRDDAISAMQKMEAAGLVFDFLEQPVPAVDLAGMKAIRAAIKTPLLADESVFTPEDAQTVLGMGAADIVNIKLMKSSGISRATSIAGIAQEHGASCMIGVMLEGPISVAAAACFAAAHPEVVTRFDLDGPSLASVNPIRGGTEFIEAAIHLPATPGLGIEGVDGMELFREFN